MRVCTNRHSDVLKRQFSVVDGQEWQRQKAKHDDLRALFVRVGISQSHFLHALNNCLQNGTKASKNSTQSGFVQHTFESFARLSSNVALQIKSMWY